ncbi:uncharacterized protein si:ch211-175m2.4 [Myxocyprinus asiaticus]|uniref:uncharacterized protein si:ch211-175m2.4 n=1 Tax=Myxocyprinus asiaticus TaxID=70543 RepID=UPI002223D038|nr:uncharacterized protein si:ch211-175m2.4 [Myxocyprinus asiaticus]
MIATPVYQQQPNEVSRFLKIKPLVFGVLEILTALIGIGFIIWQHFWFHLWSPVFCILTGAVTVSAACKPNPCLVKTAQVFNYVNIATAATSLRVNLVRWGLSLVVLMGCDILALIFSIIIASSSCFCCCRPKSRSDAAVSYMNTNLPVNNIVFVGQLDPSALPQPGSSVLSVMPANYRPVPTAPPAYYVPVPTALPGNYGPVPNAHPANYGPLPTTPPPAYEACVLESRTQ